MSKELGLKDNLFEQKIIERDTVCQNCEGDKLLQIPQIYDVLESNYGKTPDNYVTLCKFCRDKYHAYYDRDTPINLINFLRGIYEY